MLTFQIKRYDKTSIICIFSRAVERTKGLLVNQTIQYQEDLDGTATIIREECRFLGSSLYLQYTATRKSNEYLPFF